MNKKKTHLHYIFKFLNTDMMVIIQIWSHRKQEFKYCTKLVCHIMILPHQIWGIVNH